MLWPKILIGWVINYQLPQISVSVDNQETAILFPSRIASFRVVNPLGRPVTTGAYLVRNTSLLGNFSNAAASCPKFVARMSAGLPAIHCDKSMV